MAQALPHGPPPPAGPRPVVGVAVFAGAALYLFPFWERVGLDSDEAKIILGALRVLQGEKLYTDIFAFVPPGLYAIVAGVLRVAGPSPDIFWVRLVAVLFAALGVLATWGVAARATGRPLLALVPAALALTFGFSHWAIASVHWVSTTFALLATYTLLEVGAVRAPWRPWFLSGLAAGAVLLVAQHKGIALGAAAAGLAGVYILHAIRHADRPVSRLVGPEDGFAAGILLVVTPLCISLVARGQFVPMLTAAFGWTREGYGIANRVPYGHLASILFRPDRWHVVGTVLGGGFGALSTFCIVYVGPACLVALLVRGARRWHREPTAAAWADLTIGLVGLAMWTTALTRPDVLHLLTVAPWSYVAATLLLANGGGARLPSRRRLMLRGASVATALVVLVWGVSDFIELRGWASLRLGRLGFLRYPRAHVAEARVADSDIGRTLRDIRNMTRPDEPIFVYPYAPYIYYLADRPNPTRFNICFPGYQGEEAIRQVIDDLERFEVPFVIMDPMAEPRRLAYAFPGYDPATFTDSPLTQYIQTRYTEVRRHGDMRIFQRRVR